MNTEKMTIHKALCELKTLDSRILDTIDKGAYVLVNKHSNEKINGKPLSEVRENMRANYQKVMDLIARRNALKRAVVLSNAVTKVVVNDVEYTVAEAIEMKNHGMDLKKYLLREASVQYRAAQNTLNSNSGETLERKAEAFVQNTIAAQPKDSKMSIDSEVMQSLRKNYIENNTYDLVDAIGVEKVIDTLTKEIDGFTTDVDSALSVSNALTIIEFEY